MPTSGLMWGRGEYVKEGARKQSFVRLSYMSSDLWCRRDLALWLVLKCRSALLVIWTIDTGLVSSLWVVLGDEVHHSKISSL